MKFLYIAWFRDATLPPDDQDYEWPVCIGIEGEDEGAVRGWGDHLAQSYARRSGHEFIWSRIEAMDPDEPPGEVPLIREGYEASDEEIGW